MSWAHILSLSRIVASPFVAALILDRPGDAYLAAALIFALASLTDLLDGKLARYARQVSPLGIFLDTTADKVLVSLTLIALAIAGLAPGWIALVVVGREFLISGLRSYGASHDHIISSHSWGKGKTVVTMAAIFFLLVALDGEDGGRLAPLAAPGDWDAFVTLALWLLVAAALLTILSGLRYLADARPLWRTAPRTEEQPAVGARE